MKIVVAPDSFKGSLSARDICDCIGKGIQEAFPEGKVIKTPLADGGEGTMENLVFSSNGTTKKVLVKDPIGRDIYANYGILGNSDTVVIEMAQASGLPLLLKNERNPLKASSFGTGQLILDSLDEGYRKFILGLGGSATNDGGIGMLSALGVKFYDENGNHIQANGEGLKDLFYYDDTQIDPRLKDSTFVVASDVSNKLCGTMGASAIFGPQKGATPELIDLLDHSLNNFAEVVLKQKKIDMRKIIGGGAAGGMGAALMTFLNAQFKSGINVVMEELDFEALIKDANLIITGEGKLDQQTMSGKVIAGVSTVAKKYNVPVIALCGGLEINRNELSELGINSAFSIVRRPCSLDESVEHTSEWITTTAENIIRTIIAWNPSNTEGQNFLKS